MNFAFQNLELRESETRDQFRTISGQVASHNGTEQEESMDVEAGQFEDAEEDP